MIKAPLPPAQGYERLILPVFLGHFNAPATARGEIFLTGRPFHNRLAALLFLSDSRTGSRLPGSFFQLNALPERLLLFFSAFGPHMQPERNFFSIPASVD
ncbi:MAG: hypothetical protein R6W95_13910 [Desulfosarcina sp.]